MALSNKTQDRELKITESFLQELTEKFSNSLVGKVMRRLEICEEIPPDKLPNLKNNVKEILYEELRSFKQLLNVYSQGYGVSKVIFTTKEK